MECVDAYKSFHSLRQNLVSTSHHHGFSSFSLYHLQHNHHDQGFPIMLQSKG